MEHQINRKTRIAFACTVVLGAALIALPALAADNTQHLRGQITSVSDSGFLMTTKDGDKRQIMLKSKTKIAAVTPGDLSSIEPGTFIGTANVEKDGQNRALEMVIFPPSMKGTGVGDYGWDLSPSMSNDGSSSQDSQLEQADSMAGGSSMTNGTVSSKTDASKSSMSSGSSMTNGTVNAKTSGSGSSMSSGSSMTNGTVTQSSGDDQTITLNVDYGKGSKKIVVPTDVPTVKIEPGSRSDLKSGAHVFVAGPQSSGDFKANMVIIGKNGTVPPM